MACCCTYQVDTSYLAQRPLLAVILQAGSRRVACLVILQADESELLLLWWLLDPNRAFRIVVSLAFNQSLRVPIIKVASIDVVWDKYDRLEPKTLE